MQLESGMEADLGKKLVQEYIHAIREGWQLTEFSPQEVGIMLWHLGRMGSQLFAEEFSREGPACYKTSLIQAVRNLWHSSVNVPTRWNKFFSLKKLPEPILDWGSGVGFMLKYFQEQGLEDVYGYDVSPIQMDLMKGVGLPVWDGKNPSRFGTVVCCNTLEHLEDPVGCLKYLQSLAPVLYANCEISEQPAHIAPMAERIRCNQLLKEAGSLIEY